jgi:carboxylesterase type B
MEQYGQPNAGLLDQRAILQFVHDQIKGVKGNSRAVSVWGESAGASSIMHHLVMPQNIKKPLFQKAVLQSPAYQWLWARNGDLNSTFTEFAETTAKNASCPKADMACLQSADTQLLRNVNQKLFQRKACDGIIPIGPSVDGKLVTTLAPNSLRTGKSKLLSLLRSYSVVLTSSSHVARITCSFTR